MSNQSTPELSEPQRWLLAQKSFRISHREPGRGRLAAEWEAAAADLIRLGCLRRSNSGRYWPTEAGRAALKAAT